MYCNSKIVVFDLDETLGYFVELGMLWDAIKECINNSKLHIKINQELFNTVLDLYPEFLRPKIIDILSYLKSKKQKNDCTKIMIYTNNQGPYDWAKLIMKYFESKLNYNLFDQLIGAYKVNGKRVELCRTTNEKTYKDLIKCTKIPEDTEICFLDDIYHPKMKNDKIYYINVKPYKYDLEFNLMIDRLLDCADIGIPTSCRDQIMSMLHTFRYNHVGKTPKAIKIDQILSKKIMQHLQIFFKKQIQNPPPKGTKRNIKLKKNKTIKKVY